MKSNFASNAHLVILGFSITGCVALAYIVNIIYHVDIVYTHLFYIPILIAGVWYHRKALLVAVGLGLIHIGFEYYVNNEFSLVSFLRTGMFLFIAFAISTLSIKKDKFYQEAVKFRHLDQIPMPIALFDMDFNVIYANEALSRLAGIPADEILGKKCYEVMDLDFCKTESCPGRSAILEGKKIKIESTYAEKNLFFEIVPLKNEDDQTICLLEMITDLTELNQRKKIEEEYKLAIQTTSDGFMLFSTDGKFTKVNDAFSELLGYTQSELMNMSLFDTTLAQTAAAVKEHIRHIVEADASERFEILLKRKNGEIITADASITYIPASSQLCAFLHDITERKQKEQEILYLGTHDILTGLYNRNFFDAECRRLDETKQTPVALVIGDINGLKFINEVFGNDYGDDLLRAVAEIFIKGIAGQGTVTRIGGDEFCAILPGFDAAAAQETCKCLYQMFNTFELHVHNDIYRPNVSLGIAVKTNEAQKLTHILKEAEDSMHKHKLLESRSTYNSLIENIRMTMFEKSQETLEHTDRLSSLAKKIGIQMGLSYDQQNDLELIGSLHDIGKIGVGEHILNKKIPLTEEEWEEIKRHPEIGYRIALASPELVPIAEAILSHHERWDGTGYPQKLSGEQIPLTARIIAIADSFDAMTNDRVYRKALAYSAAVQEIVMNSGKQFDPDVVGAFLLVIEKDETV